MNTPNKKTDPVAYMRKHFSATPPQAIAAFEKANAARRSTPKGTPTVIPLPPAPTRRATAQAKLATFDVESHFTRTALAAHVRHGLRCFKTPLAVKDAVMTLREALAKLHGHEDPEAVGHRKARKLPPMMIGTTTAPTGGGYLTPDAVTGAIQLRLTETGAARDVATVIPVTAGQASVPVQTTPPTVYYVNETSTITDSASAMGSLGLNVTKRGVLTKVSNELMADSAYSMLDTFIATTANALGAVEDDELVNADGSATYGNEIGLLTLLGSAGVYAPSNGTGKSVWSGFTGADFAALVAKLPAKHCHPDNKWLMSKPFFAIACAAMPAAVSYDAQARPYLMGSRVVLTEKMPRASAVSTVSALYGDFANAVTFADRGIVFLASDLAAGAFENNLTYLRATSRYDLNVNNMGDSSTAGAVVGLKTAAS